MDTSEPAKGDDGTSADEQKELFDRICAAGFAELAEELTRIARPAAVLRYSAPTDAPVAVGVSKLGGEPDLPDHVAWPTNEGTSMSFVAQIELRELVRATGIAVYGRAGWLSFFYDAVRSPWRHRAKGLGGWKVLFTRSDQPLARRALPRDIVKEARFRSRAVEFSRFLSIPTLSRVEPSIPSRRTYEEFVAFGDLMREPFDRVRRYSPLHQFGGFPDPMQSDDMELQCQLDSHGVEWGSLDGTVDPRVKVLEKGAHEWRLLLQLDEDNGFTDSQSLRMQWGFCGRLYFWIREDDLRALEFDHALALVQQ